MATGCGRGSKEGLTTPYFDGGAADQWRDLLCRFGAMCSIPCGEMAPLIHVLETTMICEDRFRNNCYCLLFLRYKLRIFGSYLKFHPIKKY